MRKGYNYIYYGCGRGKTTLAIGQGIRAVGENLSVIMIQFLDYNHNKETIPLKKLEPDFRVFRFEKMRDKDEIDEDDFEEIQSEIKTAFNFTKKIMETGECDMLILDGIIDAVTKGFLSEESMVELLEKKSSYMNVILTGSDVSEKLFEKSDFIYHILTEKITETEN